MALRRIIGTNGRVKEPSQETTKVKELVPVVSQNGDGDVIRYFPRHGRFVHGVLEHCLTKKGAVSFSKPLNDRSTERIIIISRL